MKNNPLISVIVPVYRVEKYVAKCIESLKKQTFKNFEVLVIDDESPDNSISIVKKLVKGDKRFKIISQTNKGLGGARNTGIKEAKGKYLFFLDSDDYIKRNTLELLIDYIKHNYVDIVVFDYCKVDENGKVLAAPKFGKKILNRDDAYRKILSLKISPMACNKLYKKELFIENNIFYPEKFLHEDVATTYKLFWGAAQVGLIGELFYYWVVREESITQKVTNKHINDVVKSLLAKKQFLEENNVFSKFEIEYIRGSVQMLNLLLERSLNYSKTIQCYEAYKYIGIIIKSELVLTQEQIKKLEEYDRILFNLFIKNTKKYDSLEKEMRKIERFDMYTWMQKYYCNLRNTIFPIGSKRRDVVKKLIGRK